MIVVDKPFVSDVLARTLVRLQVPVLKLGDVNLPYEEELTLRSEEQFIQEYASHNKPLLLCNSENPLQFIVERVPDEKLNRLISVLKDKVSFRNMLRNLYPNYQYSVVSLFELDLLETYDLPYPFIIKPAIGYSSIGVYLVADRQDLAQVIPRLKKDMEQARLVYPVQVVNRQYFIIEQWIQGDEYAVDAYFGLNGEPVILNMFKRMFASASDTSDRIYYTSRDVISEIYGPVMSFLHMLGSKLDLSGIPIHFEIRMAADGTMIPIEINPLRFAGVGTNELGIFAYGVNVYDFYFRQLQPDWESIMLNMNDKVYSFFCAEYPINLVGKVDRVDIEAFQRNFEQILDYRPMPYQRYPGFAIVFYVSKSLEENKRLLELDVTSYLHYKKQAMA